MIRILIRRMVSVFADDNNYCDLFGDCVRVISTFNLVPRAVTLLGFGILGQDTILPIILLLLLLLIITMVIMMMMIIIIKIMISEHQQQKLQ